VVCTVRDYWPVCYWSDLIVNPASPALCPRCTPANMTRCVRPRAHGAWPLALPFIPYMRANLGRKQQYLAGADAVIAVSRTLAADLRARAARLTDTRVETIPNPVDLAFVRAAEGRPAPLLRPYALYVGKLAPNKGTAWLVDVVRMAHLAWPLVVIGDGPDRPQLEAAVAEARLDVRLEGWQPREEALRWMAHAALIVFPSYGPESLSRVLLEAGALGRAIAAMDTGGTRDIISHESTGLLSTSPAGLAGDVARLAADEALRTRLGAAARAHVEATFDANAVVRRVEQLYGELLRRPGAAGA
jgi:glycosyltransferase involved in cell wall biosynthesis